MKIAIFIFTSIVCSLSMAEAPTAKRVASTILNDSGLGDATGVTALHITSNSRGSNGYILSFTRRGQFYTCSTYNYAFNEARPGQFAVEAEINGCSNESAGILVFSNDYTDRSGNTLFRRLFVDNNTSFHNLSDQDAQILDRYDGGGRFSDESVRVIRPGNSNRIIIFGLGEAIPLN